MTRKDYILIQKALLDRIEEFGDKTEIIQVAYTLTKSLKKDNPNFKEDVFLKPIKNKVGI